MQGSFDATQFKPNQGGDKVPPGIYDATIANTVISPTKDNSGGMFVVDFATPSGTIVHRYNMWNQSAKAVEIAHGQLSALSHATGVFRIDWTNDGAALRGARCKVVVGYQAGQEPSADNPAGGYTEIKKVLDVNGNEPGKAPASNAQPQGQQQQPLQKDQSGNWGNTNPNPNPNAAPSGGQQWGNGGQPQNPNPNPNPNPAGGGAWQPGGTGAANPPWGNR